MFIREFASSLNLMGVLSLPVDDDLGKLSAEYGTEFVSKIRRTRDGAFRMVNVPRVQGMDDREMEVLGDLGSFDGSGWYILDEKINHAYVEFFNHLIDIPSVVIDSALTTDGTERIFFRAHETDRSRMRDLVYGDRKMPENMYIEKLDFNPGLVETMKTIDSYVSLTYLEYSMKIPPKEMEVEKDPVISTFGNNWIREVKFLMDENANAVYYEKSKILRPNPNIKEISREDNIFRMAYSNPVINTLVEDSTSMKVALLNLSQKMLGRDFYLSFIVPTMCLHKINGIMRNVMKKYSNWGINISEITDITTAQS